MPATAKRAGASGPKKAYLVLYNAASAIAWSVVFGRVAAVLYTRGAPLVPLVVNDFARNIQTVAIMEILHALTGVVPAPVFTTAMQVASRLLLVWGISFPFPALNSDIFYSSMLLAWSTTEIIRYTYFALKQFDAVPGWLHWLRYSAFTILYPIGISSEVKMIFNALLGPAGTLHEYYPLALVVILLSYIPGSVVLFSHMLSQRKKYLSPAKAKKTQ
ncbi:hypothetical protein OQA88_367 [Cercophora sp. LCS_1]